MLRAIGLSAAFFLLLTHPTARADEEPSDLDKPTKVPKIEVDEEDKPEPRFPSLEDVTENLEEIDGLITLYRAKLDDPATHPEKLLGRIPKALLGEDLLFATSISRGGFFTGWMWTDHLVRWEIAGDYVVLATPDTAYVHSDSSPVTDAVQRTYNDRYLASAKILTITPGGDPVFDLGPFLKSNLADVAFMGGSIKSSLSRWAKVKNFPDNVLIDVDLAMTARLGRSPGGRHVGVSYAFRRLPKLGTYQPRVADDRVGYFLTARTDWSKPAAARDTFQRYVNRWQLEKRDPSLEMSPPKRPITFVIEKTVPVQWRRWVRQGILEWNKAFEQIGIVDAIVVQQQTEDNEFADYDPEDARYNFFRWIVTGSAFAMGPSRADPRTGQILDADIIMDDSFVRAWMHDLDLFSPSAVASMKGPGFRRWLEQHPELRPHDWATSGSPQQAETQALVDAAHERLAANGHERCAYATGFQHQMSLLHSAFIATGSGQDLPERVIGEAIREVVAHEVGHALGLRHNFKASSWLTLEEIKRRRDSTDEPTSASVMDYNPLLFFEGDEVAAVRHFVTPCIGPYDYWAIQYGYGIPTDGSEADFLKTIASRCAEPGLDYATDEDTMWVFSPDPRSNRFDMGSDPADWVRARFTLADRLLKSVTEWGAREGESRYHVRRAFDSLLYEKAMNFDTLGRMIAGQYFHRDHKGDPQARPPFVPVSAADQRKAFELMCDTLFDADFFRFDPETLNALAPSRWSHRGSWTPLRMDYPIHDRVAFLQWWTLFDVLSPPVLQRLYDAELKCTQDDRLTAAEYLTTVCARVWSQLEEPAAGPFDDASPFIDSLSRGLQREHLGISLGLAQMRPGWGMSADLHAMVRHSLRELGERIDEVLEEAGADKLDFASRAHLTESRSRIQRVLQAQFAGK